MNREPPDSGVIDLSGTAPIARGAVRDVYARPGRSEQILKRLRADKRAVYDRRPGLVARLKRRHTLGPYKYFLKEYRCYLRTAHRAERMGLAIPIAEFGAVVRTDRGLAQVVSKVSAGNGELAPTLRALLRADGFADDLLALLNRFVADIYALGVVAPDLSAGNVVLDGEAVPRRFVLVDGYGEKSFVPLRNWIPALNARRLDRQFALIGRSRHLAWNRRARRYDRPADQ